MNATPDQAPDESAEMDRKEQLARLHHSAWATGMPLAHVNKLEHELPTATGVTPVDEAGNPVQRELMPVQVVDPESGALAVEQHYVPVARPGADPSKK